MLLWQLAWPGKRLPGYQKVSSNGAPRVCAASGRRSGSPVGSTRHGRCRWQPRRSLSPQGAAAPRARADPARAGGRAGRAQRGRGGRRARVPPPLPPLLHREIRVAQARLQLAALDLTAVEHWSITSAMYRESLPLLLQEQEELMVARLVMAQEKASALRPAEPGRSHTSGMAGRKSKGDEALHLLAPRQVEARQQGRTRSDVDVLILMRLVHFAHQRQSQAWQRLREALALAHAEGYQRLFLDEGEPMMALLRAVLPMIGKEPPDTYVRTLLRAFARHRL